MSYPFLRIAHICFRKSILSWRTYNCNPNLVNCGYRCSLAEAQGDLSGHPTLTACGFKPLPASCEWQLPVLRPYPPRRNRLTPLAIAPSHPSPVAAQQPEPPTPPQPLAGTES